MCPAKTPFQSSIVRYHLYLDEQRFYLWGFCLLNLTFVFFLGCPVSFQSFHIYPHAEIYYKRFALVRSG